MYTSPNIGLVVWDQKGDDFEHPQLVQNWIAIDEHDHSPGKGVQISGAGIKPGSIGQSQLAEGSVGNAQIQANAISDDDIQAGTITGDKIKPGSLTGDLFGPGSIDAAALDQTIIPLGYIVLWWRPPGSNALPGGYWEIMDGRPWSSITNFWNLTSGNIPDMRGHFAQGADLGGTSGPVVGATGGSATADLTHIHAVDNHTHLMAWHQHSISVDGSHSHTWVGGLNTWSRANAWPVGTTINDYAGVQRMNTRYTLYIKNILSSSVFTGHTPADPGGTTDWQNIYAPEDTQEPGDARAFMDPAGSHSHGGATGFTGNQATGDAAPLTGPPIAPVTTGNVPPPPPPGSADIIPPYVGLLYIMRVR